MPKGYREKKCFVRIELLQCTSHNKGYLFVSVCFEQYFRTPMIGYGIKVIKAYQTSKAGNGLAPHIYGKCKDIVKSMCLSSKSQCCVLTGDSASGKTECLKHILQYIVNTATLTQASLKSKFLQVQFILETFGNAVTLHNSNSSRFAMYYEVYFSPEYKLSGGKVHHYMLEQSRIVHQEKGGKNFHIFDYLLHGLDVDQLQEYNLSSDFPHRYLCYDPSVPAEDNASKEIKSEKYSKLISYMEAVGFSNEEIVNIINCVASVLHIGNVAFVSANPQTNVAVVKDPQPVQCAGALLGVPADGLTAALITGTVLHKGVKASVKKPVDAAAQGRDNLARTLYGRLFSWIVLKVNSCLKEKSEELNRLGFGPSLGLLDVFGSERFEINGFEQLTINTANEQLAYFYNQRVFAWEQAELESEGLRSYMVPYHDNKKAVELLLNPPQGLLPLLDEECKTLQTTDAAFVKKCNSLYRKHPNYAIAKLSYPAFTIRHYSGPVTYVTLGFLKGNRDVLGACLQDCLQGSSNEFVNRLFKAKISGTGSIALQRERLATPSILMQKKKFKRNPTIRHKAAVVQHLAGKENRQKRNNGLLTFGSQFRKSITDLMEKVLSCEAHFVRCIKPSWHQSPGQFDPDLVLTQVRSLALVQTVRIRNLGYPVWFTFDAFIQRFGIIIGLHPLVFIKDMEQTCLKMLRNLADPRGWKMAKTKVFLTIWCLERLNALLDQYAAVAVVIQKAFRGWKARRLYCRLRHLKVTQENAVKKFLDSIGKRSEGMFEHISNQVMEEDAKQKLKVNEMQPWSPDALKHKSPSSPSQQKGFDFKDIPDGFPPLSPRPMSPQKRTSDLASSSIAFAFSTSTPTRPGPPQSRLSDVSMMSITSIGSAFSDESEEYDTAAPLVWCKITLFEREHPRAEFTIDRPSIVIDNSSNSFDVTRIGLGSLPPSSDAKVTNIRACVGKGIEIVNDEQGNVWATRGSKNFIFVKGHFLSDEVIASRGALEKDATLQVFDWDAFADSVRHHCLHATNFDPKIEDMIVSSASIYFSFVKDGEDDVSTPCWAQLDVIPALQQGKAACKYAREKRQQERQQAINSLPPILRPKTKQSRELSAMAHFQQKIRPRRYIDSYRYSRKKWARKKVALNPFLYGNKDELSQVHLQRPLKAQQRSSSSEPNDGIDGSSHVPDSLMGVFANSADVRDGGTATGDSIVAVSDLEMSPRRSGLQYKEPVKGVVASTSVEGKPAKKVWAKKKVADSKAEKGKKRS